MTKTSLATPAPEEHSDLVGGSTAGLRINCPGSYQMEKKLPASVMNKSSDAADEGSACHAAMAHILDNDLPADSVAGMTFAPYEKFPITQELMRDCIVPCVEWFDDLVEKCDAEGGLDFVVEKRCEFAGIPNAFGTSDLIGRTQTRSIIADWKFGTGKAVYAYYEEPIDFVDDETKDAVKIVPNEQLMFYAFAAMHTHPDMFDAKNPDWPIDLYICQPRHRDGENFDHVRVTVKQLFEFRSALVRAIAEATGKNPATKRGSWCEFRPCRSICPHFTGPMLDAHKLGRALGLVQAKATMTDTVKQEINWSELYNDFLLFIDLAQPTISEIEKQAHAFMKAGGKLKDYKLVPKRATESYVEGGEDKVRAVAVKSGVAPDDCWEPRALKTPAQMGKTMEPFMPGKTKKEREDTARSLIAKHTTKVSSGDKIAPMDDKRETVITMTDLTSALGNKLAVLTNG